MFFSGGLEDDDPIEALMNSDKSAVEALASVLRLKENDASSWVHDTVFISQGKAS